VGVEKEAEAKMQGGAADGEALDFEPEDDDLMDEDGAPDADASPPHPKLKSAITAAATTSLSAPKKTKGRGFRQDTDANRNTRLSGSDFDSLTTEGGPGPQRCQSPLPLRVRVLLFIYLI